MIVHICREIMSLSNALIYNNRLVCGSEEVASGRLSLPHLSSPLPLPPSGGDKGWLERAIDPSQPVVFLSTDRCSSAKETIIGDYICNEFEAGLVRELVLAMIRVQISILRCYCKLTLLLKLIIISCLWFSESILT